MLSSVRLLYSSNPVRCCFSANCQLTLPIMRESLSLGPSVKPGSGFASDSEYLSEPKNHTLSAWMGPPTSTWYVCRVEKKPLRSRSESSVFELTQSSSVKVKSTNPRMSFEPDFVVALTTTPSKPSYSAGAPRPMTLISWRESKPRGVSASPASGLLMITPSMAY